MFLVIEKHRLAVTQAHDEVPGRVRPIDTPQLGKAYGARQVVIALAALAVLVRVTRRFHTAAIGMR
jgi:hypothetical protein